jgi:hypothetical protein
MANQKWSEKLAELAQLSNPSNLDYLITTSETGVGTGIFANKKLLASTLVSLPLTNILHVDSVIGNNSTGDGSIGKPYLTPEYVLANVVNTGTFGCDTNTNTTLSTISDANNALLKVGQFVTGTNLPYGTIITAKNNEGGDSNSVVISQATTGTAAITGTWFTMYELKCSGSFTYVSTLLKNGFVFDFGKSSITFNNTVFNATTSQLVPFYCKGGTWRGNTSNSKLWSSTFSSVAGFIFEPLDYLSIGTGIQIDSNQNGVTKYGLFIIKCPLFRANFGTIASFEGSPAYVDGDFYGLLGGITVRFCRIYLKGAVETPLSINALVGVTGGRIHCDSAIYGQLNISTLPSQINNLVVGTTHTLSQSNSSLQCIIINGNITGSINNTGRLVVNGEHFQGSVINSGFYKGGLVTGSYTGSGSSKGEFTGVSVVGSDIPNVTLTGTSIFTLNDSQPSSTITAQASINIQSGCKFINDGFLRCRIFSLLGTGLIINNGTIESQYNSSIITGKIINNGIIELTRDGQSEATAGGIYSPVLIFSTGTYQGNGDLICDVADSKSGLIRVVGAANIFIKQGQYLKVANGLAPIQILTTAGSTTIYDFGAVSNVSQATYDAAFTDTTYGATSAPTYVSTKHSTSNNF